jgi:hypothetical protein
MLEAKKMCWPCYNSEESMRISLQFPRFHLMALICHFQHLNVECLIKSGPFGYKFKVDDAPELKNADQHSLDLGLQHPRLLWSGDSP